MGVKDLRPLIKRFAPSAITPYLSLLALPGRRLAIDGNLLLNKLHFSEPFEPGVHLNAKLFGFYRMLIGLGFAPITVFDGARRVPQKRLEQLRRMRIKMLERQRYETEVGRRETLQEYIELRGLKTIRDHLAHKTKLERAEAPSATTPPPQQISPTAPRTVGDSPQPPPPIAEPSLAEPATAEPALAEEVDRDALVSTPDDRPTIDSAPKPSNPSPAAVTLEDLASPTTRLSPLEAALDLRKQRLEQYTVEPVFSRNQMALSASISELLGRPEPEMAPALVTLPSGVTREAAIRSIDNLERAPLLSTTPLLDPTVETASDVLVGLDYETGELLSDQTDPAMEEEIRETMRDASEWILEEENEAGPLLGEWRATLGASTQLEQRHRKQMESLPSDAVHNAEILINALGLPLLKPAADHPHEAEGLCSTLFHLGHVDYVASEDLDVVLYGAPLLAKITLPRDSVEDGNLETTGGMNLLDSQAARNELNLTREEFIELGLLLGTDFSDRIPRVGPVKALKILREHGSIDAYLASPNAKLLPEDQETYIQRIEGARKIFREPPPLPDGCSIERRPPSRKLSSLLRSWGITIRDI